MTNTKHTSDVGAPDPDLNTSPIADENSEDTDALRQLVPGEPVCFFNDRSFAHDDCIKSGASILKCDYGIWIPVAPGDPDNP